VNYFSSIKFIVGFNNVGECSAGIPHTLSPFGLPSPSPYALDIKFENPTLRISREFLASTLIENCNRYAHEIMKEFFNAFGELDSPYFDDEDNLIQM
jgi:hypothetical protein